MFEGSCFAEPYIEFETVLSGKNASPLMRKRFTVNDGNRFTLRVCALGYGYCYINGKKIGDDLFAADNLPKGKQQ